MSAAKKYVLDANVLIEAKRRYYPFGLCPGFWDSLLLHHAGGRIESIDRVEQELERGKDDLANWISTTVPGGFFAATGDADVVECFGQMLGWVQSQGQFSAAAKAEFASVADGWLIAYAKTRGLVLVTHEVSSPDARRKVPIPNVCDAFGVSYVDSFVMLTDLGVQFILKPSC